MKIESTFSSDVDSLGISMLEITPDQDSPKAVVQLVHGICEYKERYIPFMEYLSEHGIASVIHDHRGHGKSVLRPEHLGYMYGGRGDALIRDIEKVNRMTREKYPDTPLILLGHSMGALAVLAFTTGSMVLWSPGMSQSSIPVSSLPWLHSFMLCCAAESIPAGH